MTCKDCKYFYEDLRDTVYRRDNCFFCKRRGVHFSRNVKQGEGNRVMPDTPICENFSKK